MDNLQVGEDIEFERQGERYLGRILHVFEGFVIVGCTQTGYNVLLQQYVNDDQIVRRLPRA